MSESNRQDDRIFRFNSANRGKPGKARLCKQFQVLAQFDQEPIRRSPALELVGGRVGIEWHGVSELAGERQRAAVGAERQAGAEVVAAGADPRSGEELSVGAEA